MKNKTILVIEDSYTSYLLIAEALKLEGFETQLAEDVKKALTQIKERTPDLIILDLNLPEITGYDFLSMREKLDIDSIPIIVISALDSPESKNEAKTLGASEFIPKPVNLKLTIEKVKSLVT